MLESAGIHAEVSQPGLVREPDVVGRRIFRDGEHNVRDKAIGEVVDIDILVCKEGVGQRVDDFNQAPAERSYPQMSVMRLVQSADVEIGRSLCLQCASIDSQHSSSSGREKRGVVHKQQVAHSGSEALGIACPVVFLVNKLTIAEDIHTSTESGYIQGTIGTVTQVVHVVTEQRTSASVGPVVDDRIGSIEKQTVRLGTHPNSAISIFEHRVYQGINRQCGLINHVAAEDAHAFVFGGQHKRAVATL